MCNQITVTCKIMIIFKIMNILKITKAVTSEYFHTHTDLKGSYDAILKIIIWCNRIC